MSHAELLNITLLSIVVLIFPFWRNLFFFSAPKSRGLIANGKALNARQERKVFFDFLRGLSILAVIVIHAVYFFSFPLVSGAPKNALYFINNIFRFAVPIFFICSGILLRPPQGQSAWLLFYGRKLMRIFLPYALVVTAMAFYYQPSGSKYLVVLFTGKASPPYYFIIVLLQLYLLYPLVIKWQRSKYFLFLSFLLSLTALFVPPLMAINGTSLFFRFLFFFAYGIAMRDYFLAHDRAKSNVKVWWLLVLIYIISILILPEHYYNARFVYALAVFNILFYYQDVLSTFWPSAYRLLCFLGRQSLWIYLLHFLLAKFIFSFVTALAINIWLRFILLIIITTLLSILAAMACSKAYNKFFKILGLKI